MPGQVFNFFQILVHNPQSFPEVASKGMALGIFEEAFIELSAHYTERWIDALAFERALCCKS
jgi:hypothetical protein